MNNPTIFAIIFALFTFSSVKADQYPGDVEFSNIVQRVYHEVSADNISMSFRSDIVTRGQLCSVLVNRHNSQISPGATRSNASFIGVTLSHSDCLNALWYSSGYSGPSGWLAWAGVLRGTWFNDNNQQFNDSANWLSPVKEPGFDSRNYDLQTVIFTGRTGQARYGWNVSHPSVDYVWGWDQKDNANQNGERGTHVGWTFQKSSAQCIVWATPEEAFLECVKPSHTCASQKRRVSAGFFGMGQWTIGSCSSGGSGGGRGGPRPILEEGPDLPGEPLINNR